MPTVVTASRYAVFHYTKHTAPNSDTASYRTNKGIDPHSDILRFLEALVPCAKIGPTCETFKSTIFPIRYQIPVQTVTPIKVNELVPGMGNCFGSKPHERSEYATVLNSQSHKPTATLRLHEVTVVAEWYRYRIVACLVTSSNPVPPKTRRAGQ
ncbi:hypothetical protein TNCV_4397181 [Trichonephila clavipes]|nr:hypothetical protein TNCV_4397181 [Trichonephila clavipes]